jgi:uncharacterized membrane protein
MTSTVSTSVLDAQRRRARRAALLVFCLLFATDAFAYLDPGTGSILVQGLIAAVAAVVTYTSLYWQRTKAWFRSMLRRPPAGDEPDDQARH